MTETELHRDIGRMEANIKNLEMKVERLEGMLFEVHKAVTEAQGGWKVLLMVGGASAAVGAAVAKLVTFLKGGG